MATAVRWYRLRDDEKFSKSHVAHIVQSVWNLACDSSKFLLQIAWVVWLQLWFFFEGNPIQRNADNFRFVQFILKFLLFFFLRLEIDKHAVFHSVWSVVVLLVDPENKIRIFLSSIADHTHTHHYNTYV